MKKAPSLEAIFQDYGQDVQFVYVYKALAHPENNGYAAPFTLQERLMHVEEAKRTLGSQIPWICDTMTNDLKHALGDAPNSEFIFDPDGIIVRRRAWSDPRQLRADLVELVGPVENPTSPNDVKLGTVRATQVAQTGIVPRVQVRSRMLPLKIEPKDSSMPYYAKLRAEASMDFLTTGKGELFLSFYLDPLYRVHWNNVAKPLKFRLEVPKGVQLSTLAGEGPNVEQQSDSDPREFLIDIRQLDRHTKNLSEPMVLTVDYFACNDEEGWCLAVSQQYQIFLDEDRDGGWVAKRYRVANTASEKGSRQMASGDGLGGAGQRTPPPALISRLKTMLEGLKSADQNGDERISREEASLPMPRFFDRLDTNRDGWIDSSEIESMGQRLQRMQNTND